MYPKSLLWWVALASFTTARSVPSRNGAAPLMQVADEHRVPGMYIVKMRDGFVAAHADRTLTAHMSSAKHTYGVMGFKGFAGALNHTSIQALRANPHVEYVEEDSKFYLQAFTSQKDAPWGIARVSHRKGGRQQVHHPDFGERASWAANFADDDDTDGAGHGTYVAGIVGSRSYGVAKKTKLLAVKVFRNDGTTEGNP
ncbi:hypothetical protein NUW58_g7230 [Xylaria curta]|uniref:Uncharacterized protein n=1 Tax=Xylaria curta TaxID=42375 RepID=A0ACC1NLU3_9PEZI|nr:hypothetical protein NUW58_g7230 [Xylaria curta]